MLSVLEIIECVDNIKPYPNELVVVPGDQVIAFAQNIEKAVLAKHEPVKIPVKQKDFIAFESLLNDYGIFRSRLDALHKEYQGKAMSDQVYMQFTRLRDIAIPELREKLLTEFLKD